MEWGIDRIRADQVWSTFGVRGEGITVANIDTGVEFTHPALVGKYRGNTGGGTFNHNYNWFDPSNVCGNPSLAPCDNNNHGTHTMGTMVGDDGGANQIGVAPGARWIAAKGCETNNCSDAALLASGQWILAPTDLSGSEPAARSAAEHRQQLLGRRRRRHLVPGHGERLAGGRDLPGVLQRQLRPGAAAPPDRPATTPSRTPPARSTSTA